MSEKWAELGMPEVWLGPDGVVGTGLGRAAEAR